MQKSKKIMSILFLVRKAPFSFFFPLVMFKVAFLKLAEDYKFTVRDMLLSLLKLTGKS